MAELNIEKLVATNRALNRRCQELQSIIAKNKHYDWGWRWGYEAGRKAEEGREIRSLRQSLQKQGARIARLKRELAELRHG